MNKRAGMQSVQSRKTIGGCGHCQGEALPVETGNNRFGVKQIHVKHTKQGEENKEKRNRAS